MDDKHDGKVIIGNSENKNEENWLSVKIISRRLGVSKKTARRRIDENQFNEVAKFGRSLRVSEKSFNDYVDKMIQKYRSEKDA